MFRDRRRTRARQGPPEQANHHELRRVARDALLAAELGAAALVVGAVEPGHAVDSGDPVPAVTQVVEAAPGMRTFVDVVDGQGTVVGGGPLLDVPLRVEGLPAGIYHLVVRSESPVEQVGDVAISAATARRTDPFAVPEGGAVVVSSVSPV